MVTLRGLMVIVHRILRINPGKSKVPPGDPKKYAVYKILYAKHNTLYANYTPKIIVSKLNKKIVTFHTHFCMEIPPKVYATHEILDED